jgi:hypothetical protein
MAVLARAAGLNWERVTRTWNQEVRRGASDSASVAVSMLAAMDGGFPNNGSRLYWHLFPRNLKARYPLSKFLILCVVAVAEARSKKAVPRLEVQKFITNPWMKAQLKLLNPAWFALRR